jgi:hypothetical protein
MNSLPISAPQAVRMILVFVGLIIVFGILSSLMGWPDKQGWSVAVILSFVIATVPYWRPVLEFLRESGAVVEVAGVKVDFSKSVVQGSRIQRGNLQDQPGVPVTDSNAASIAQAAQAASSAEFIVVDLGTGTNWYPTRLFALAAAAEELRGAKVVVILAQRGGIPNSFIGWICPRDIVAAFVQSDHRYQVAVSHARTVLWQLRASGDSGTYPFTGMTGTYQQDWQNVRNAWLQTGDLAFVPALISGLQKSTAPDEHALEDPNAPRWLTREDVERLFDAWMVREHVAKELPDTQKRAILCKLSRADRGYLAVTEDDGSYRGMIKIDTVVRTAVLCGGTN